LASDKVLIEVVLDDGSVKKAWANIAKGGDTAAKDLNSKFSDKLGAGFNKLALAAAAAGAAIGAALFSKASIEAAIVQENAIQRLNQSLASAGRFSQEASQRFQDFASEIQRTTVIGDETTLGLVALASNFARTNDQAEQLTRAAIELSAATGKDLNSSLEALGKTLSGTAGRIAQEVPVVKGFTAEQLKAGAAIDAVLARFQGSAAGQVNTYSGALTQAKNAFGDLLEVIGNFVIKSPVLVELLKVISNSFAQVGSSLDGVQKSRDILGELIIISVKVAEGVNKFLIAPFELFFNFIKVGFQSILVAFLALDAGIKNVGASLVKLLPNFKIFDGLKESIKGAADDSTNLLSSAYDDLSRQTNQALNVDGAAATALFLEDLRIKLENAKPITQDFKNNTQAAISEAFTFPNLDSTFGLVLSGLDTIGDKTAEAAKKVQDSAKAAGAALAQGLGSGAANAFAAFGKAIATGENALQAFTNSLLATIGQASIQLGTNFILQGAAYSFAGLPNGPALIGAGAALAAFGGILSGFSGGAATAPAPGTPGGSPLVTSPATETPIDEAVQDQKPSTEVVVNINGSVMDSEESGLRIVELIEQAFDKQGVTIKRGVMA